MSDALLEALRELHSAVRELQNGMHKHASRDQQNVLQSAYKLADQIERDIEL